ncbi:MAG: hypothetical protein ACTSPO_15930 [Candidatus Heimdallarchaeaceae archaeon]
MELEDINTLNEPKPKKTIPLKIGGIIVVLLVIIGVIGFIILESSYKTKLDEVIIALQPQETFNAGIQWTINSLVEQTKDCNVVPITTTNETIRIIREDC